MKQQEKIQKDLIVADIYAQHQNKYKKMPANHVRMGIYGLLRLSMAWQKTCTPERAVASFKVVGQYPFDPRQVLMQCTAKLTTEQETKILLALDPLTAIYKKNGGFKTSDFDRHDVPNSDTGGKLKEDLIMSRQRTKRLTHSNVQVELAELLVKSEKAKRKRDDKKKKDEDGGEKKVIKSYCPRAKKARIV